jgi:hypothetical protein
VPGGNRAAVDRLDSDLRPRRNPDATDDDLAIAVGSSKSFTLNGEPGGIAYVWRARRATPT